MPDIFDDFRSNVLDNIVVSVGGKSLSYYDYISISPSIRSGDEADVVDSQFTTLCLRWLGWNSGDWKYNSGKRDLNKQRPDFRILQGGRTAFIVEDKSTCFDWGISFVSQLRGYSKGTSGIVLWTNAREFRLCRFKTDGSYSALASCSIEALLEGNNYDVNALALCVIHSTLLKANIVSFESICRQACVETTRIPLETTTSLNEFIDGAQSALSLIGQSAELQVYAAIDNKASLVESEKALLENYDRLTEKLFAESWREDAVPELQYWTAQNRIRLGSLSLKDIDFCPSAAVHISAAETKVLKSYASEIVLLDSTWRQHELDRGLQDRILAAYELWLRKQPSETLSKISRFSEQAAYIVFVRLLLVRILEDKLILPERIASNGGFEAWLDLMKRNFTSGSDALPGNIFCHEFLRIVFRTTSTYYSFEQPVFDWLEIDDLGLARLLSHLNMYDFTNVTNDVIGYTYEKYINRTVRSEKGQFLTRNGLVEYVLDTVNYSGSSIIGRRLLDHACGSGSFLVHAARRLRTALLEGYVSSGRATSIDEISSDPALRIEFAITALEKLADLVGLEIDPFSCYLAELNLLIQGLDDLAILWQNDIDSPIDRLCIYNTDSLELSLDTLSSSINNVQAFRFESVPNTLDPAWDVKTLSGKWRAGFDYIVANPPFVSAKKQHNAMKYSNYPFYRDDALSGDANLYLFFFRLVEYYLANGGKAAVISPVNLCGDESGQSIRNLCTTGKLRVIGLTRFTSATVLFDDVDHWTMVTVLSSGRTDRTSPDIDVRFGFDENEAKHRRVTVPAINVLKCTPYGDQSRLDMPWTDQWLLLSKSSEYDLYHYAKQCSGWIHDLCRDKMTWKQGDVSASKVNPFRITDREDGALPLLTGSAVQPWAPISFENCSWVMPPEVDPEIGVGSELWRIKHLEDTECGFLLGVQQNLHVSQRLRGTWFDRRPGSGFVFTHSTWRILAHRGESEKTKAVLGLLNSYVVNFLFSSVSTNFNITQSHVLRIPCPSADTFPYHDIANMVDEVLSKAREIARWEAQGNGSYSSDCSYSINVNNVLYNSDVPTISVCEALLSGELMLKEGRSDRIDRIIEDGRMVASDGECISEIHDILAQYGTSQLDSVSNEIRIPRCDSLDVWRDALQSAKHRAEVIVSDYSSTIVLLNEAVADWYNLTSTQRDIAKNGVPWEYNNARKTHRLTTQTNIESQ